MTMTHSPPTIAQQIAERLRKDPSPHELNEGAIEAILKAHRRADEGDTLAIRRRTGYSLMAIEAVLYHANVLGVEGT